MRTNNFSHTSRADIVGPKPDVHYHDVAGVFGPIVFDDANLFAFPAPGEDGAGRNIFRTLLVCRPEPGEAFRHYRALLAPVPRRGVQRIQSREFRQPAGCIGRVIRVCSHLLRHGRASTTQSIIQTRDSARILQLGLKLD